MTGPRDLDVTAVAIRNATRGIVTGDAEDLDRAQLADAVSAALDFTRAAVRAMERLSVPKPTPCNAEDLMGVAHALSVERFSGRPHP